MDSCQNHSDVVGVIRALLKELNHELVCSQRSSPDGKPIAPLEHREDTEQERIAKDTKAMVKNIEFHADVCHNQSGGKTMMVAKDSNGVIMFWRGLSIALKRKYIREFVECEYTHLHKDQQERVYDELNSKMLRGTLDSRIQWNGYHIECVRGLSVTLPAAPTDDGDSEESEVSAVKVDSTDVVIDFIDNQSDTAKKSATAPAKKRSVASATMSNAPSVHNLRTQIQRQKKEAQMRLRGELDDAEDDVYRYNKPSFRRRW